MSLKKALVETGVCKENDLEQLALHVQISDGIRNDKASSRRYFVTLHGRMICSVKRLPVKGIFNIDDITKTQMLFSKFSTYTAPEIYGVYHSNDNNIYIVEEAVLSSSTLQHAVASGNMTPDAAAIIIKNLFQEVASQSALEFDRDLFNREVKDFFTAIELLDIPADLNELLKNFLSIDKEKLIGNLIYTSRDLISRNILITDGKPVVVDFDLSRRTHFFWLDILRSKFYSKEVSWEDKYLQYMPKDINPHLLELLFFLSEVCLQKSVFSDIKFIRSIEIYREMTLIYFEKLLNRKNITNSDVLCNKLLPKIDGCNVTELNGKLLQVYWSNNDVFTEEASIKVPLVMDGNFHEYELPLPQANGPLRIDPGNQPAYVQIKKIVLYIGDTNTTESAILAQWCNKSDFAGFLPGAGVEFFESQDKLKILCLNNDPRIVLENVPNRNDDQLWVLKVVMSISENALEDISEEIKTINLELIQKEEQLNKQNDELTRVLEELSDKENQLSQQAGKLLKMKSELFNKEELLSQQADELATMRVHIKGKDEQICGIKKSRSWRITVPIRWIGSFWRLIINSSDKYFGTILRSAYKPILIPLKGIFSLADKGAGMWEAVESDPQFLIDGPLPKAWTLISWVASSEKTSPLRLYMDRGSGFNETDSICVSTVNSDYPVKYSSIIYLDPEIQRLRLDPGESPGCFSIFEFKMTRVTKLEVLIRAVWAYLKRRRLTLASIRQYSGIFVEEGMRGLWKRVKEQTTLRNPNTIINSDHYEKLLESFKLTEIKIKIINDKIKGLSHKPLFSIIIPVYNVDEQWLRKCIESVQAQLYSYWELCIADDASTKPHVKKVLKEYASKDDRIKIIYREKNGHISAASNSALELATGEFIALLDHDDELTPDALYENAVLLNKYPDADMIYSDEDKITEDGRRHSPFFKPDWSPDTFLSQMYTCHLGVYRTELIRQIGGFREGFEGSQDYDLVLRLSEKTKKIYRIPKILYHWRTISNSTALSANTKSYAHQAGLKAIKDALLRRDENGWVETADGCPNLYRVHYNLKEKPLISIIIPTRDMAHLLSPCLQSVFDNTTYSNFEVIIIDNGSVQQETIDLFTNWTNKEPKKFRVERLDIPFNYSKLNNEGARLANGELILLLNNDTEIITPNWLEEMAGYAMRTTIGVVGAKLLYPDQTIQHTGVILGIGGVAGHGHKGFVKSDFGYFGALAKVTNVSAVTGACMMVKKELFEAVGGLDEELQVAFNDVDFCLKIQSKGLYNVVLPHVQLYHYESKSRGFEDTPEKQKRFQGEVLRMQKYWGDFLINDPCYNPNLTLEREDFSLK